MDISTYFFRKSKYPLAILLSVYFLISGSVGAEEKYLPPGYGSGQNLEGTGFGFNLGYKKLEEDYYLTVEPILEFSIIKSLRVGIAVPLEILVYDRDPKGEQKVPSLRFGTYNSKEDYIKLLNYVRYGTHLFFDPDDLFNWSFFYGKMTDGYLGHKTIVKRYVGSYDPTVFRAGLMVDINNNWGGIELFESDVWHREVVGVRGYIRPFGIYHGIHDMFVAGGGFLGPRQVYLAVQEQRNVERNGGIFFQESLSPPSRKGGSLRQYTHEKLKDADFNSGVTVRYEEYKDPVTGETTVRAVPVPQSDTISDKFGKAVEPEEESRGFSVDEKTINTERYRREKNQERKDLGQAKSRGSSESSRNESDYEPPEKWGRTFWSRLAFGYSVVTDYEAPLSIEKDGSNQLVIDPDTNRPRGFESETLTFVGTDVEFRFSPFRWMDLTPYTDLNRIKHLDKSKGTHVGVDFEMRFLGNFIKIMFKPEYREVTANYIPVYFDSYYSLERTVYRTTGTGSEVGVYGDDSMTKLQYLKTNIANNKDMWGAPDPAILKGSYGELMVDIAKSFVFELSYENYTGENNSRVFAGFYIPNIFGFFLNGYYTKKNFNKAKESFVFDDRSLFAGELGFSFYGGFYVKGTYERTWVFNEMNNTFVAQDEKSVLFGFSSGM